ERVRVNLEYARFQLGCLRRFLGKDYSVFLDGVSNRLVRHFRDGFEHIPQPNVLEGRTDLYYDAAHVDRLSRLHRDWIPSSIKLRCRSRYNYVRVDQEVDTFLVWIPFKGFVGEKLQHALKGQSLKKHFVKDNPVQLALDGLAPRSCVDEVGRRIG